MTDRHAGYIVTLEQDIRADDAEDLIKAIRKGFVNMTDLSRFPAEVRAKIEDLDRRLEGINSEREEHQAALNRCQNAQSHVLDLRQLAVEMAEVCLRSQIAVAAGAVTIDGVHPDSQLLPPERKRRDIRGEVLKYFIERGRPATADMCAATLDCQRKSVEQALMYHEREGQMLEMPGGWIASCFVPVKATTEVDTRHEAVPVDAEL